MKTYDLAIIGGGIVGVSSAWQLKRRYPDAAIVLIEKEASIATHQTGHNSGVIHAGVYYQPGSLKADFCKRGAAQTIEFCRKYSIPFKQCGKMLVATDALEYERMAALESRCIENGIALERLDEKELHAHEPNITGLGALKVMATGITDYVKIAAKMADLFVALGGEVRTGCEVEHIEENSQIVRVRTGSDTIESRYLLACGGLMADRLANMIGIDIDFQIVPFRGEYFRLPKRLNAIVRHLIYPIPDPELPFLGVHLTRMIDGSVTVGPNAVLGWKREGYGRFNLDWKDSVEMLSFPGFWSVIRQNLVSGISEMKDSLFKSGYLKRIRKYCPQIASDDLRPYPAGIRAQAVKRDGSLVHDFLFAESERSFHVCNAPSPAATSAMPIGEFIGNCIAEKFDF
ncbi:MAG: L-2-hydroxyglutarate oxidase [Deltaproteobacteria bacterium]|jgi:L-2-hydroxyglutarate oxidase|nr:L-2-hydroxyglutarate oxidase [Deltaproteobacteria bacterium]